MSREFFFSSLNFLSELTQGATSNRESRCVVEAGTCSESNAESGWHHAIDAAAKEPHEDADIKLGEIAKCIKYTSLKLL